MAGKTPWNKGKKGVYSNETKKLMSDAKKGNKRYKGCIELRGTMEYK